MKPNASMTDRYLWHETIQTQHTRRSFREDVAPHVLATVSKWLDSDAFDLPGRHRCVILYRGSHCLEAEVYSPAGVRLIRMGVAGHGRCAQSLWERIGGAPHAKPDEPWCGVWLDYDATVADLPAYDWLGDFERCLAWAFLDSAK